MGAKATVARVMAPDFAAEVPEEADEDAPELAPDAAAPVADEPAEVVISDAGVALWLLMICSNVG